MSTKAAILAQLEQLQAGPMTRADQVRSSILLAQLANIRTDEATEQRAVKREDAFRSYLRTGEFRADNTDPMSGGANSEGGYFVAAQWNKQYQEKLRSFSGLREAGATVQETAKGGQLSKPIADDVATSGVRLAENVVIAEAIPAAAVNKPTLFQYSSKGVLVSMELAQDTGFDLGAYLQRTFAQRIGKIANNEFTLGVGGGPTGIVPSITVGTTAAGTTAVTVAEIASLPSKIDYAYRAADAQPCYMFSDGVEAVLKSMVASGSGERMFPEMSEGKLCGYPYCVNVDMASSLSASGVPIVFGSVKRGVLIHSVTPSVIVSTERFADYGQVFYSMLHRQGVVLSDANALTALKMHA